MRCFHLGPFFCWVFLAGLVFIPCFSGEQGRLRGDLIGFIYEEDGTSPVEQAELIIEKIPEARIYKSNPTDGKGLFRIQDVEKGIYRWGVKMPGGKVNGLKFLGIRTEAGDIAQIYIALTPAAKEGGNASPLPIFPDAIGEASILAGNTAVVFEIAVIDDQPREAGPFRIR